MAIAVQPLAERFADPVSARFAPVLDHNPEGIALLERGRVVYANSTFADLFGFARADEILGQRLAKLRSRPDRCGRQQGGDPSRSPAGNPICEFDAIMPQGRRSHLQAKFARFAWQSRKFLIVNVRELRDRERRRAIRDSERRYRAIFHAAAMGILQCSAEGRVLQSNPAIERMLGHSRHELRGAHLRDLFHSDGSGTPPQCFDRLLERKGKACQADLRYTNKLGVDGWVRVTASMVAGVGEEPPFLLVMTEDITSYKNAERQLRDAQKMEAIGRLVGGVAHDFNNLLTGIMLYCDLLNAGLPAGSRSRHHAEEIRMAGEQGAALVQQLLAIARQQVVEPRTICLNAKIAETRNLLARLIGENIDLQTELDTALGNACIDPAQVQQILLNLVLNARDAMPSGGRICVRTANCDLPVPGGTVPAGAVPGVMLSVADNGCGMSAETRSHLFEPFFTTKNAGRGNGLGLATVHDIVQKAGGVIAVDSELGTGTTFRVILPRIVATENAQVPGIHYSPTACTGKILVLEDNVTVRQAVCRILCECGYEVVEAANGLEALQVAKLHGGTIDLLLADLWLPGMSGRAVAAQLRATEPTLKCLYMSGYEPEAQNNLPIADPVVFFRKPFTGAALLQRVREVLDTPTPLTKEGKRETP